MDWYALFVKSTKEERVRQELENCLTTEKYRVLIPLKNVVERKKGMDVYKLKKLFPGYVLFLCDMNYKIYTKIKSIQYVYDILGIGEYYSKIPEYEINSILALINEKSIIDISRICIEDSQIIIKEGPLKGFEGKIKTINKRKKRAKVVLFILGEKKIVDVGIEVIK